MRLLNVGGGSKEIPLPDQFKEYEHILLDVTDGPGVDVVCDARQLSRSLFPAAFDVVYCSHNLEHYYDHEVPLVLAGMRSVLTDQGRIHIAVPNIGQLICDMIDLRLDIDTVMYECGAGPVTPLDVLYGFRPEVATGNHWYAHKTGFTASRLHRVLEAAGFVDVSVVANFDALEIIGTGKSPGRSGVLSPASEGPGISVPSTNAPLEVSDAGGIGVPHG
jgi:SAM-dependent methyltransferase